MAVSDGAPVVSHKRRNRRRRQDKPAITARLVLDDRTKGDVGFLSDDLFADLFRISQMVSQPDGNAHWQTGISTAAERDRS